MARSKINAQNIDNSDPNNYLQGRIKDNTGAGNGTGVNEFIYGDLHQTFAKLMALYGISYNDLPDNETNGYQLIDALRALPSKNDFLLNITSVSNVLQVPLKLGSLGNGECFVCKASVAKGTQTQIKGTLDNVTKGVAFYGSFKADEYVRVINFPLSVVIVREVDITNFVQIADEYNYLKKATQTQENAGKIETAATTPKTNKTAFIKRVNGTDSDSYLASPSQNGLMSKEDKVIINGIGAPRVRNVGYFAGLDINQFTPGTTFAVGGDIVSATLISTSFAGFGSEIDVVFDHTMDNHNYKLHFSLQSQGSMDHDNNLLPVVWKPVSTTKAKLFFEEINHTTQNLKVHIDVIQL